MGHSRSLEMAPFDTSHTSSYSSSVVTMAVSCTVFEISYTLVEKRQFFIPLPFNLHDQLEALRILIQTAQVSKLLDGAKILPKSSTLWIACTNVVTNRRQTDGSCHKANVTYCNVRLKTHQKVSTSIQLGSNMSVLPIFALSN